MIVLAKQRANVIKEPSQADIYAATNDPSDIKETEVTENPSSATEATTTTDSVDASETANTVNEGPDTPVANTTTTNTSPELRLFSTDLSITQGGEILYDELVVSAVDEEDGDLTAKVTHNDIDTSVVGSQILTFSVTDSDGNTVSQDITVVIDEPPVGYTEADWANGG